jgi:hypothetical protein
MYARALVAAFAHRVKVVSLESRTSPGVGVAASAAVLAAIETIAASAAGARVLVLTR